MGKVYIIYYDFSGTSGNHAGMAHLVRLLDKEIERVHLIKSIPHHYTTGKYIAKVYAVLLAVYLKLTLKKEDKVFFFEYLTRGTAYQALTAQVMRSLGIRQPIYALIHLSGQHLVELFKDVEVIKKALRLVDKVFVLGSSLASFLGRIGYQKEVVTTFHYVDTDYYKPIGQEIPHHSLQVICIGSLKRDFSLLKKIVSHSPSITYHILMGKSDLRHLFTDVPNVKLYPFLSEPEMLRLMQSCDVSVSVMEDTIGSNVITTSMAVGLVQVVSDVGSIRDYCDESNSFLCNIEEDYLMALEQLSKDRSLLHRMRQATLEKAHTLSHKVFTAHFNNFV